MRQVSMGRRYVPATAAYTGPGDVQSGAVAFWGLRSYNEAYAAPGNNPAIDVVDTATGLIQTTVNILSNGNLDEATILGLGYTVSVKKFYDQTGNGVHLTQSTLSQMPTLTPNEFGSLPGMDFTDAVNNQLIFAATTITQAQPLNYSIVLLYHAYPFNPGIIANTPTSDPHLFDNTFTQADTLAMGAGSDMQFNCTAAAIHAINCTFNGTSSVANVDGTETTGNAGTTGFSSGFPILGAVGSAAARSYRGTICEAGIWPSAWTTTIRNNLRANQKAYWGTP